MSKRIEQKGIETCIIKLYDLYIFKCIFMYAPVYINVYTKFISGFHINSIKLGMIIIYNVKSPEQEL